MGEVNLIYYEIIMDVFTNPSDLFPIDASYLKKIDNAEITSYLIEDSLEADFIFEYTKPFDFFSSSASFQCIREGNIRGMLDVSLQKDNSILVLVSIGNDFLGYIDIKNSSYDPVKQIYTINCIDLFQYIFKSRDNTLFYGQTTDIQLNNVTIPHNTLKGFLLQYISVFGKSIRGNILAGQIGSPTPVYDIKTVIDNDGTFNVKDYNALTPVPVQGVYPTDTTGVMTYNQLLFEMQKYYNAIVYIDGSGTLNFISKNIYKDQKISIDGIIMEEKADDGFALNYLYNSILINVIDYQAGPDQGWYHEMAGNGGWALLVMQNGNLVQYKVNGNMMMEVSVGPNGQIIRASDRNISPIVKIPSYYNYLDVRQKLSHHNVYDQPIIDFDFPYNLFQVRTLNQNALIYDDILTSPQIIKRNVIGTDLKPYQHVAISGNAYVITRLKKNYHQDYSELELRNTNINY